MATSNLTATVETQNDRAVLVLQWKNATLVEAAADLYMISQAVAGEWGASGCLARQPMALPAQPVKDAHGIAKYESPGMNAQVSIVTTRLQEAREVLEKVALICTH